MLPKSIRAVLEERLGLNTTAISEASLKKIIHIQMTQAGAASLNEYIQLILRDPERWQKLSEALIVPETWFFRNRAVFRFLADYVSSVWLNRYPRQVFNALSIPCASGEEPYSIAITLKDAGLPWDAFQIDAADINPSLIERARRGIYGPSSYRGKDLSFRDRHFKKIPQGWQISGDIQKRVHFFTRNILNDNPLEGQRKYDVIFCRNLLIYFNEEAKIRAVKNMEQRLKPDGMLFTGHAEQEIFTSAGFVSTQDRRVFACYRKYGNIQHRGTLSLKEPPPSRLKLTERVETYGASPPQKEKNKNSELLTARKLADRGLLKEALRLCHACIEAQPCDAEAHFLCGLIYQSMKQKKEAELSLNRAVYLAPHHHEALYLLALMADERGDKAQAARLKNRARRAWSDNIKGRKR